MDSSLEDRKESKKGKSVSFKLFEKKDFQVSNISIQNGSTTPTKIVGKVENEGLDFNNI